MEQPRTKLAVHPKKFALWLFIVSITMLFAAFTSAYLVKASEGIAFDVEIPFLFTISTLVIVLSSVSIQWALNSARKNEIRTILLMLVATTLLGSTFLVTQFAGWGQLVDQNAGSPEIWGCNGTNSSNLLSFQRDLSTQHISFFCQSPHFFLSDPWEKN